MLFSWLASWLNEFNMKWDIKKIFENVLQKKK